MPILPEGRFIYHAYAPPARIVLCSGSSSPTPTVRNAAAGTPCWLRCRFVPPPATHTPALPFAYFDCFVQLRLCAATVRDIDAVSRQATLLWRFRAAVLAAAFRDACSPAAWLRHNAAGGLPGRYRFLLYY